MFQYPLVIALGDAPHFGQLLRTAETAQPPPVVENRPDGLRADTADRTQRRRVGRIQLHRIVQRTPPFGEEGVLGQTPARRIADNRIVAQLLLVAETADEGVVVGDRLGLPLRETDRAQEFRRHRVDAEGHERHDDPLAAHEGLAQTLRTVAAGPETILRPDADIGFQTVVHRIAHLIAGGEILRYAEDLSRGPIAQHARRILLGEAQPPQRTVIDRIGIELEQLRRRLLRSVRRRPAPRRLRFEQQERRHGQHQQRQQQHERPAIFTRPHHQAALSDNSNRR